MLSSQRALFDIPSDVCFLNAASWSPLPLADIEAGEKAVRRKGRPWLLDHTFAPGQYERARRAAARLIHADPEDMAAIVLFLVIQVVMALRVPRSLRAMILGR